jgi:hypothetical protein
MGLILLDSSFLTHCAAFSFAGSWELILVYFITFIHEN